MTELEKFVTANVKLVHFEQELDENAISQSTIFALEVHRDELKSIWANIKSLYEKCMEELSTKKNNDDDDDSDQESVNSRYQSSYETYVKIVSKLSASIQERSQNLLPSPNNVRPKTNFHLPACEIKVFEGSYISWPSFRDMFSAIYIKDSSLSGIQKLFYLREKTQGDAFDIVEKAPLTNGGFEIAWNDLQNQFENKRRLIRSQLSILFNLPIITIESSEEIKRLQREINACVACFKVYDLDLTSWDGIFDYICYTKLPRTTLALWEQSVQNKKDVSKWSDLSSFLSSRVQTLETISEPRSSLSVNKNTSLISKKSNYTKKLSSNHTKISTVNTIICKLCPDNNHIIRKCPKFIQMNSEERSSCIKKFNLCLNCFSSAHAVKDCKSNFNCFTCNKRHNTLLHRDTTAVSTNSNFNTKNKSNSSKASSPQIQSTNSISNPKHSTELSFEPSTSNNHVHTYHTSHSHGVLLGTAIVEINHLGLKYSARALIDSGSQGTFISERLFNILKLPYKRVDVDISGLNGITSAKSKKLSSFSISSRFDSNLELNIQALVVPYLSGNLPSCSINPLAFTNLPNVKLADSKFYESSRIDLLIGADIYNTILLDRVERNVCGSLVAQETIFGWIITGSVQPNQQISTFASFVSEDTLEKQLKRFWEVEDIPQNPIKSPSDTFCENLYSETTTRDSDGRYIVSLPFKKSFYDKSMQLGQSRPSAYSQFLRNETRLLKNIDQKLKYDSVIREYIDMGHMEPISSPPPENFPNHFYLPHHAIIKPERTTTKIRVVFNASCPTSSGNSLNDILYTGPTLQSDLTILLLKWRFYQYVFNADIEKMYRQIKVNQNDTPYQRILFRSSPSDNVQDFELKTVTFGVNCAPYLAIRTLLQLAQDVKDSLPLASQVLLNSMYVDDVIAGTHDLISAIQTRNQLISALNSACFPLRKWTSNSTDVLKGLDKGHILKEDFLSFEDSSHTKTLGVKWNAKSDKFLFDSKSLSKKSNFTKREVLSEISKLFDPAGWLAPVVVLAKILMRQIWVSKIDWDENLSPKCLQDWKKFLEHYPMIDSIQVPRWISYSPNCNLQFHAFCDASENAYAAAIYTRVQLENQSVFVNLLTSKSRVSPVKNLSIPKLELCGAVLLADMVNSIIPSLNISNYEVFKWTDSTIVLSWLRKDPCNWKVFVANRISKIVQKTGSENWFHVDSKSNPADLASRGVYPHELRDNRLWWYGPEWLKKSSNFWPIKKEISDTNLEQKSLQVNFTFLSNYQDILDRFSSFHKAIRVLCYVFRFIHNTRSKYRSSISYSTIELTAVEVLEVKNKLIVLAQKYEFPETYKALLQKESIPKSSKILNLNPFFDDKGQIRANGRLANSSSLSFDEKYPIILPYNCQFSRLLVHFTHILSLHGGNQLVLRLIRMQFWIPKLKNLIKTTIHNCKICVLHKKRVQTQIMSALPLERTVLSRPFHCTGIDFAGPFEIKNITGRGSRVTKGYVCIFVCFSTKAIHLEATSSLSTSTFLAAFHRFISRRGCPLHIYSDNGKNFVGASREIANDFLTTARSNVVSNFLHQNLSWHFIPPGAPHMGGLWEAGVKSFKTHLKKVSTPFKYTFEEFCTLLSRIEACLNSRPISTMSQNPTDLNPLTPGHFLTGGLILAPPEPSIDSHPESVVNRWQRVKVLQQQFCQRWKTEYLTELHKRNKWKYPEKNIEIDSIVVIRDENLPPNEWRIGRVVRVYVGPDNKVRVADIYTQKGTIKRPIVKLVLLPTQ